MKNKKTITDQERLQAGINHRVNSFIVCIQEAVTTDTQKPRQRGQEKSSPKKGALANKSSDHSSNVKMSYFDIRNSFELWLPYIVIDGLAVVFSEV
ncbi:MAG: hypothetical protein EBY39_15030, partial [Flavobacteriia bacterium]|nr:hypothetical protein [Flavobacteriia bacterium]